MIATSEITDSFTIGAFTRAWGRELGVADSGSIWDEVRAKLL